MNPNITMLKKRIAPIQDQLLKHALYQRIHSLQEVKTFMEHHVYAVWDFMSLLKSLQNELTCTTVPWYPVGNADTRFLINEIVLGEESDIDPQGSHISHFELYLKAMTQAGADTSGIKRFVEQIKSGQPVKTALESTTTSRAIKTFVSFTFDIIQQKKPHVSAAVFTFGREDLIPGIFMSLVNDLNKSQPENIGLFKYYLERHIEVDGTHHSHLALSMTEQLCGNDASKWAEAEEAVAEALHMRLLLWNGILETLS